MNQHDHTKKDQYLNEYNIFLSDHFYPKAKEEKVIKDNIGRFIEFFNSIGIYVDILWETDCFEFSIYTFENNESFKVSDDFCYDHSFSEAVTFTDCSYQAVMRCVELLYYGR